MRYREIWKNKLEIRYIHVIKGINSKNFMFEIICKKLIVKFIQEMKTFRTITFTGVVMNKIADFLYAINANTFDK